MNKQAKILLPIIRKMYSKIIAQQIIGVQPMTINVAHMFRIIDAPDKWSEWRLTTSIWPRQSITGKWIFGRINKCSKWNWRGRTVSRGGGRFDKIREHKWATDKELFEAKLKGTA